MLLLFTCSPKKWIVGALECVMVPHLVFIVHFVFSLKKFLDTVCSLYIIYIIMVVKIESFIFLLCHSSMEQALP